jgi:hypothetical protein
MAANESYAKAIFEKILNGCYWFHDISIDIVAHGDAKIVKVISPGVLAIVILFVVIIVQTICPNVLKSLIDFVIQLIKAVKTKVSHTEESASNEKAFTPLYKSRSGH